MKKLTAMILALALVFSLGATVFAEDGASMGDNGAFHAGEASTDVNIRYSSDVGQLSATVPMSVTLAVKGDKTLVAPAATAYKIHNGGQIPFHVSGISITAATGYALVDTPAQTGDIKLSLMAGTDEIALSAGTSGNAQTIGAAAQWDVAAGGDLGLTFKGGSVFEIGNWTNAKKIFTITYTIAVGVAE